MFKVQYPGTLIPKKGRKAGKQEKPDLNLHKFFTKTKNMGENNVISNMMELYKYHEHFTNWVGRIYNIKDEII